MSRLLILWPLLGTPTLLAGVTIPELVLTFVALSVLLLSVPAFVNCINLLNELLRNFDSLRGLLEGLEDLSLPTKLRLSLLFEGGLGLNWL